MLTVATAFLMLAQGQSIVSPEIRPDHTVVFRYKDPAATKVTVNIEGATPLAMTKDAEGVWSATATLSPDIYGYTFAVDGETRLDPRNPSFKPNLIWQSNMVAVPGGQVWEQRNVPHGTLHRHFYRSELIGDERDYIVYTPAGYQPNGRTKYPVIYLLHGYSDTSVGWTDVGKAHVILDNLIADGKAKPMVVVMPLGYGVANFHHGRSGLQRPADWNQNISMFARNLLEEVQPAVERAYKVSTNPKDRAIAGLSMGGAETLTVGLNNLDRFSYVGAFSSGGLSSQYDTVFPKLTAEEANRRLRLLYIACGTEDGLIGANRQLVTWLKDKCVNLEARETPGAHTWMVWRRNLAEFAPRLFKQ